MGKHAFLSPRLRIRFYPAAWLAEPSSSTYLALPLPDSLCFRAEKDIRFHDVTPAYRRKDLFKSYSCSDNIQFR